MVVPEPRNGSRTTSPTSVNSLMKNDGSASGKAAGCCLLPNSVARCSTLLGSTISRPTQCSIVLPKAFPVWDCSRCLSVSLRCLSRLSAQSPIGTSTASWHILNAFCLVKCKQRSQASRRRLGYFPGIEFFLCQIYSSVHSHPCC